MDRDWRYLEYFAVASAIVGTVWAGLVAVARFGGRLCRVLPAIDRLHDLFGHSPIEELHAFVREARSSVSELEIRQRIAERHLAIGIYVCDEEGRLTWCNDHLCESFGLDSRDMRGWGWLQAIHAEDQSRVHGAWTNAVAKDLPYRDTYRVNKKGSSEVWLAFTEAIPVRGTSNSNISYVGYVKRSET